MKTLEYNKPFWEETWTSLAQGIGYYYPGGDNLANSMIRGGAWVFENGGILTPRLDKNPSFENNRNGFRCVAPVNIIDPQKAF